MTPLGGFASWLRHQLRTTEVRSEASPPASDPEVRSLRSLNLGVPQHAQPRGSSASIITFIIFVIITEERRGAHTVSIMSPSRSEGDMKDIRCGPSPEVSEASLRKIEYVESLFVRDESSL